MAQKAVKDKNGNVSSLPAREADALVIAGKATYVSRAVLKAVEVGLDEKTADTLGKTNWKKLQKMIAKARAPKKHQDVDVEESAEV